MTARAPYEMLYISKSNNSLHLNALNICGVGMSQPRRPSHFGGVIRPISLSAPPHSKESRSFGPGTRKARHGTGVGMGLNEELSVFVKAGKEGMGLSMSNE